MAAASLLASEEAARVAALASRYEAEAAEGQAEQGGGGQAGAAAAADDAADDGKLLLHVQLAGGQQVKVRLAPGEPCSRLAAAVAQHAVQQGLMLAGQRVRLQFDGDVVGAEDTPDGLGMEDGDAVDAHVL